MKVLVAGTFDDRKTSHMVSITANLEDLLKQGDKNVKGIKAMTSFLPVRQKLPNFVAYVLGFLEKDVFRGLVDYDTKDTNTHPNKVLKAEGVKVIQQFTGHCPDADPMRAVLVNLYLSTDSILPENLADYAKKLKGCIGWQTPKYRGKVYRAACHSPIEIFMMAWKHYFYLPSFIATTCDPSSINFEPIKEGATEWHNVLFEIDTHDFPNFTTLLNPDETPNYYTQKTSLISCYNIFQWVGYKRVKILTAVATPDEKEIEVPLIQLKIVDYVEQNDVSEHRIRCSTTDQINQKWFMDHGTKLPSRNGRNQTPESFHEHFRDVHTSFMAPKWNHKPIVDFNADWDSVIDWDTITEEGEAVDGAKLKALEVEQEKARKLREISQEK